MVNITVKLYSILMLDYAKKNTYDSKRGIAISAPAPISIEQLCGMISIDPSKVSMATVNGVMTKNLAEMLPAGSSEIGLHPQPPSGG